MTDIAIAEDDPGLSAIDRKRMERALAYIAENFTEQPDLEEIAGHVGLSEFHFQRVFTRWVGISPKRYVQHLSLDTAKRSLADSRSVLDAAFDAGLSGPGRLHDLFVTYEAMTPGEYKKQGEGLEIRYGFHDSPFGECLLMTTDRGICGLGFTVDGDRDGALDYLAAKYPKARHVDAPDETAPLIDRVFSLGRAPDPDHPLRLLLRGTPFQLKVWQALMEIPPGRLATYQDIARKLGYSGSVISRAIGTANGANAISWLIPCHRVIRKSGAMGGYRWGVERKRAMIGYEAARLEAASA